MQRLPAIVSVAAASMLFASASACSSDSADPADSAIAPDTIPPDTIPIDVSGGDADPDAGSDTDAPPPTVYARLAQSEDELLGGPVQLGQVGRAWIIGNEHVRFMIQDAGASAAFHLYGGNIIGADRVRPGGGQHNQLREMFAIVDWKVLAPDAVKATVYRDGDGERAVLRVTGSLKPSRIIDLLDAVAGDAQFDVAMEYVLGPDDTALTMRTILGNSTDKTQSAMVGDFFVFGGQLSIVVPGQGFVGDGSFGQVPWLAARGDATSYGYIRPGETFMMPIVSKAGTGAILSSSVGVAPGEELIIERELWVGDGALNSVVDGLGPKSDGAYRRIVGTVADTAGPVAGARVTALPGTSDADAEVASNQCVTDAEGRFSMMVPADTPAVLIASGAERRPSAPVPIALGSGSASGDSDIDAGTLQIGDMARIEVATTGEGHAPQTGPFPALISLRPLGDDVRDPRLGEPRRQHGSWRSVYMGGMTSSFTIAPGDYEVVISHGPEYARIHHPSLTLADGDVISGELVRAVDTAGWLGCDFHQHTIGSLDSSAGLDVRVRENLSAGLECMATTEHDNLVDLRPQIADNQAESALKSLIGDEISVNGVGHFNAYPLPADPAALAALRGVKLFVDKTIDALFAELRALDGARTLQVNHPRSTTLKGFFANLKVDPRTMTADKVVAGGGIPADFDAIEVNGELGIAADFTPQGWATFKDRSATDVPTLADWFGLLNTGRDICAIGNSDCHDPGSGCGYPRTYLKVGDAPAEASDAQITAAIARQHAVIGHGLWMDVQTDGAFVMGHADLVDLSASARSNPGTAQVRVRVFAAPGQAVAKVEMYQNGLFVASRPASDAGAGLWFDEVFLVTPTADTWVVFIARGAGGGTPVYGGSGFAYTNPIYFDVDGDGFTAPGPVPLPSR